MSVGVRKTVENMLTSYTITSCDSNGTNTQGITQDPLVADSTTQLLLRGIKVSDKDAGRAWQSVHVAMCIEGVENPVVLTATLSPTADRAYYEAMFAKGAQTPATGRLLRIAVVLVEGHERCFTRAFELTVDVVKRSLNSMQTAPNSNTIVK